MPNPIFVLGKHRSGTTWLANSLCQHPQIVGAAHESHYGIHESGFFSYVYDRYGDLTCKNNYTEFVEVMCASDYFNLTGVTKEFLYRLWPTSYEDCFRAIMDDYATRKGARYWLEKSPSHTLLTDQLAIFYPDATFVSIVRDVKSVVVSSLVLRNSKHESVVPNSIVSNYFAISTSVLRWIFYKKSLESLRKKSDRVTVVDYSSMHADRAGVLHLICDFLDLPFDPIMIEDSAFAPNTSFRTGIDRDQALSDNQSRFVALLEQVFALIPFSVLRFLHLGKKRLKGRPDLPEWFFSLQPFHNAQGQNLSHPLD